MSCEIVLKQKGLRLTPQRRLILDIIHSSPEHLTAENIIACVRDRMPGVNKSTVYRTLDTLEHAGCVVKSEVDRGIIYHHTEEGHHHHLVCRKCGVAVECEDGLFSSVVDMLSRKYGFQVDFKHLVMNGLCQQCRKSD